jgi:O-antigen/teichoic acid export membrane protein
MFGIAIARLRELANGFGFLHIANAGLCLICNFLQLIIFSRTLDAADYSRIVFLTTIGFYFLPFSQAVGRANFVSLRENYIRRSARLAISESKILILGNGVLLVTGSFVVILLSEPRDWQTGTFQWLYLIYCLSSNLWFFDLQSTMWAIDKGCKFERMSLMRCGLIFLLLAWLWSSADFFQFVIGASVVNLIFICILFHEIRSHFVQGAFRWPSRREFLVHLGYLPGGILSALSESVVLNSPYALLTEIFGVGAALVSYDSSMKLARLAMYFSKTIPEIALGRQSRALTLGDMSSASRFFWLGVLFCLALGAAMGLGVIVGGDFIFAFLLGPNNVVSPDLYGPAAFVIILCSVYQLATYLLNYNNRTQEILGVTLFSIATLAGLGLIATAIDTSISTFMLIYGLYLASVTVFALVQCGRILKARPVLAEQN